MQCRYKRSSPFFRCALALWAVCWWGTALSQVPHLLNYQGFLTNPGGTPINGSLQMVFRLFNVPTGGSALYTETQTVSVNAGVFDVVLGSVTALNLPFDVPYYLGVAVDVDPEMTPRQPVTAAGYALRAANADALGPAATVPSGQITGTIGTAQIASNAVTAAKIASATITPDKLSGSGCGAGEVLRFDGAAWSCASADGTSVLRPSSRRGVLDGLLHTGLQSSVTIGQDGLPIAAYYDQGNHRLKVAHCSSIDCAAATITPLDSSSADVGQFPSIIIDKAGLPAISYYDAIAGNLKLARCTDVSCTAATIFIVDSTNNVGQYSSITTAGVDGFALAISYFDATLGSLKLATCAGTPPCGTLTVFPVASGGVSTPAGKWSSIAYGFLPTTGFNARMVIAYFDKSLGAVMLAFCSEFTCPSPTFATVEATSTDTADGISLAIAGNGAPVVSYYRRSAPTTATRKIAVCDGPDCAAPTVRSLGGGSFPEQQSSVAIAADGFPLVAYGSPQAACETSGSGTIFSVIKCLDATCATVTAQFPATVGLSPALTIGIDGMPMIVYDSCGNTGSQLGSMHCGTGVCMRTNRVR